MNLKKIIQWQVPQHKADLFTHVKGLLYKHVRDANQKFLALVISKPWKYTVLVEAHDKLRYQGVTHQTPIKLERNEQGYLDIYS